MSDHPMQPSVEQIRGWRLQAPNARDGGATREDWIARTAYAAGADAQLEACCTHMAGAGQQGLATYMRHAMRPKPPSLAEQAMEALARQERGRDRGSLLPEAMADADTIRRALERLAELEGQQDG